MGGEVILVAVDASNGISSDYAIEWAIQNVTKPGDLLVLLALLPSPTSNLYQRLQYSLACYFLSCGVRHNKGSSFDQVDQSKRDISRQTSYAYVHKMQQLWLANNNKMQVHYEVKVIPDAQLGSTATKAKELKASWVILDRLLKKEADHCIKQLKSNVVLIDQAVPRILKAVSPLAGDQCKLTERDTLGAIPYILDDKSATSPSTSDIRSSPFGTYSFSLPCTDQEHQCYTIDDSHDFLYLNSQYFHEDLKYQETFNTLPSYRRLDKITRRDSMISSHKHESGPFPSSATVLETNSIITQAMSHSITNPQNRSACSLLHLQEQERPTYFQ